MEPKYKVGDYVEYVDRYSRDLVPRMRRLSIEEACVWLLEN